MATVTIGKKWDMTSCQALSGMTNSFNLLDWPRGSHYDPDDYSSVGECTESPSTCKAEIATTIVTGMSNDTVNFKWVDPFDRIFYEYTHYNADWAYSWVGRFGEFDPMLEIYSPGRHYCMVTINGSATYTRYFDVYHQTLDQYVHKQGCNYTGYSWGAAKPSIGGGYANVAAGNNLFVGEGDYSSEPVFNFDKSVNIYPVAVSAGYPNITDIYTANMGDVGSHMYIDVSRPFEFDGIIDKWAFYSRGISNNTVRLKIYRGGNPGTTEATTSTLIYTSPSESAPRYQNKWQIYSISPVSVQRGDIIAIQNDNAYVNVGFKSIYYDPLPLDHLSPAAHVVGDPGNTVIGKAYSDHKSCVLMLCAWHAEPFELILPNS